MARDWQTWTALIVVGVTAALMIYRGLIRKKAGCEAGCGCGSLNPKKRFSWRRDERIRPPGSKG